MNLKYFTIAALISLNLVAFSSIAKAGLTANEASLAGSTPEHLALEQAAPSQGVTGPLSCRNSDENKSPKTPTIFNSQTFAIPAGAGIFWHSSDGDGGQFRLAQPLQPNGKITVVGQQGGSYTCTAKFFIPVQN